MYKIKYIEETKDFEQLVKLFDQYDSVLFCVPSRDNIHPIHKDILYIINFINDASDTFWCIVDIHSENPNTLNVTDKFKNIQFKKKVFVWNKKAYMYHFNHTENMIDINMMLYHNGLPIISYNDCITPCHISFIHANFPDYNTLIPINKHIECFQNIIGRSQFDIEFPIKKYSDYIKAFFNLESTGLHINTDTFQHVYGNKFDGLIINDKIYTNYRLFTLTGRPSNHQDGFNFSAMNKENSERVPFTSRYGKEGALFTMDYSAFHPTLNSYIIKYNKHGNSNLYEHLGKVLLEKEYLSTEELQDIKKIVFVNLYGSINSNIKNVEYFRHTNNFMSSLYGKFNKNGYIQTPLLNRRITDEYLHDPTKNKLFNYYLQSYESEFCSVIINRLCEYLCQYNTKLVLYTYDSFTFDLFVPEYTKIITDVSNIITCNGKFQIKTYKGPNLKELSILNV